MQELAPFLTFGINAMHTLTHKIIETLQFIFSSSKKKILSTFSITLKCWINKLGEQTIGKINLFNGTATGTICW